jgi:hypothetical protein
VEHKVAFREWSFQVDSELTKQTYGKAGAGNSETCPCSQCKNYRSQKDDVFPEEILDLFSTVGIDHLKECEAYEIERLDNGLHRYAGWFRFVGRIEAGNDCKRQIAENSWQVDLSLINDSFKIGFTSGNDLSFFERGTPLVQVEFEMNIHWVIADSWSD